MKKAEGIIQPSLFEGWSTVVEDAKAMNQTVVASNLNVHIEQLDCNAIFFDPNNVKSLAEKLLNYSKLTVDFQYNEAYKIKFAKEFMNLINE